MPTDYDNDLMRQGLIHLRAGELAAARRYLERAITMSDDWETRSRANFYMSQAVELPQQKRNFLENTLAIDPSHAEARRALAILDGKLKADEVVDANAMPVQPAADQAAQADRFTCPKCGGRMTFAPDGRTLACEYCARSQRLSAKQPNQEQDFILAMATVKGHRVPTAVQTFHCGGCGADFILPPTDKSALCAYCGSAHVLRGDERQLVEPDSIIPFRLDQREAVRRLVAWVKKNKIQPQGKVLPPRGIYLSSWTFDITGSIPWHGKIYRNKRWVDVASEETFYYNDIFVPAGKKHPALMKELLAGYDFSQAAAYDARYLAGWTAELFEIPLSNASLDARQQAVERTLQIIHKKNGGLNDLGYSTSGLNVLSFKLVLTPVWMTEYHDEERTFSVLINGASGTVHGEKPASGVMGWLGSLLQ